MALAAVLSVAAVMYERLMPAKQPAIGTMRQSQLGRRTSGRIDSPANSARQKASSAPRSSIGQSSNNGALVNSPLVLHSTAAARMHKRPLNALPWVQPSLLAVE